MYSQETVYENPNNLIGFVFRSTKSNHRVIKENVSLKFKGESKSQNIERCGCCSVALPSQLSIVGLHKCLARR